MPRKRASIWGEALLSERERFMMRKPKRDGAYLAGQRDKGGSSLKARQRQTAKERAMAAKADRGLVAFHLISKNEEASFGVT